MSSLADAPPRMPRWVKVFGIVTLLVVAVAIVLLLAGGHAPRLHGG